MSPPAENRRIAVAFYLVATYFFVAIIAALFGSDAFPLKPGHFLLQRFRLASLYVPGVLALAGILTWANRIPRRTLLRLWCSPVVFLTLALFLQVIRDGVNLVAVRAVVDAFGQVPAAITTVLLLALEIAGIVKLGSLYPEADDGLAASWNNGAFGEIRRSFRKRFFAFGLPETAAGSDEPTVEERPPLHFPDFPAPPEPIPDSQEPRMPAPPGFPGDDEPVRDLLRRTLSGSPDITPPPPTAAPPLSSASFPTGAPSQTAAPEISAFPTPPEMESSMAPSGVRAFLDDALYPDTDDIPLREPALPEEERDNHNIAAKLDPGSSAPIGAVAAKPRRRRRRTAEYEIPVSGVLADYPDADYQAIDEETRLGAQVLEETLKEFKIEARVTGIRKGPVITMFELLPSPGVKISRIVNLQDNIALRLAASRVRIVAPIPGKHAVGIEVPNKKRAIVSFSSLVESEEFKEGDTAIPAILGKDISGGDQVIDLTRTPHLLIAGATGSGKSVCVNSLIGSILYSRAPYDVKLILVDPKIVELKQYNGIPHLLAPVITAPKRALQALQWCLYEMERRYALLDALGVRDIASYNKRVKDRKLATDNMPYIVVVIDEFADLMAASGKELEAIVARLAAMSRAIGIHLVLATQRPSIDVITGLIKANFPSRIAFMVASKTDSRIIIDAVGADKLLGRGDMLFTSAWDPFPARMQGAFLAEDEVERLTDYVKTLGEPDYIEEEMFWDDDEEDDFQLQAPSGDDPLFEKALEIVVSTRKASASYLQRRLKVGYNRAARLVEEMERRGIVGPANGSKPRDLIHIPERFAGGGDAASREPSSA